MASIHCKIFIALAACANIAFGQSDPQVNLADSTGLPGDHFSLQGALDLFKTSNSLEEFEKKLNSEDNAVNNLDLNGDGNIDYIRVVDNRKDSVHAIVLQVPVSETESQDVAVIELEKNGKESATLQIIGDEELYGKSAIVEPFEEKEGMEGGNNNKGPSAPEFMSPAYFIVNVWMWPCVNYIYGPAYVVWASPWSWHYYPVWWRPWRPYPWRWHYAHCMHYYAYYRPAGAHRMMAASTIYSSHRQTSAMVTNRYQGAHANYTHRTDARSQNGGSPRPGERSGLQHSSPRNQNHGEKSGNVRPRRGVKRGGVKKAGDGKRE